MSKKVKEIKSNKRLQRGMTARQTITRKIKYYDFRGEWEEAFGRPEASGVWIVWGNSGNGKTSFVMQLVKYLCLWDTALFFSLEEGRSGTLMQSICRHKLEEEGKRVLYYSTTDFAEIKEIIRSHPHRKVVVVDSLQYLDIRMAQYKAFKEEFSDRTIIFTSHANGEKPRGAVAESIMYDAMQKVQVKSFLAITKGRYLGEKRYYNVYPKEAEKYWGKTPNIIDGKLAQQKDIDNGDNG